MNNDEKGKHRSSRKKSYKWWSLDISIVIYALHVFFVLFFCYSGSLDVQYNYVDLLYTPTYTRIGAYFIGVYAGWFLSAKDRKLNIQKVNNVHCTCDTCLRQQKQMRMQSNETEMNAKPERRKRKSETKSGLQKHNLWRNISEIEFGLCDIIMPSYYLSVLHRLIISFGCC